MRHINQTKKYNADLRRELQGQNKAVIVETVPYILSKLINDEPLDIRFRDHALKGKWLGFRECHIKPDLLLIYQKPNVELLLLVRLGSHSHLGLE